MAIAGIKSWLKSKGIEPDLIDVQAEYDSDLSHAENLKHFKRLIKTGKGSRTGKDYDAQWCQALADMCREGQKDACKAKKRDCGTGKKKAVKVKKTPKPKIKKTPIRDMRKARKKKACKRVNVRKHTRRCPVTGKVL